MSKMELNSSYVETSRGLEEACLRLSDAPVLCIDTEFHREKSFYPQLGLIQVGSDSACYLIDPLAIPDLDIFWQLLHDPAHLKVFHAGRQDIEIVLRASGAIPSPLFDTQLAAALLGLGEQASLAKLVNLILGEFLPKEETYSDWISRPLTANQITYAASDVIYLMPVYKELNNRLLASNRAPWLQEEQNELYSAATYEPEDSTSLQRVRGTNGLSRHQLAILRSLASCRERIARQRNKPRRHLISDEVLTSLARMHNPDPLSLQHLRGLPKPVLKNFTDELLHAWREGYDCPQSDWPQPRQSRPRNSGINLRAEMLSALVRFKADKEKIAAMLLAKKSDLVELASWAGSPVDPLPEIPCMQGWRKEVVGEDLLRLLRGEISLRLDPESGLPVLDENCVY
ncbi:MAG: ribonuclease D [Mariprofundaceae bacterium]